jgi:hypothetical protein
MRFEPSFMRHGRTVRDRRNRAHRGEPVERRWRRFNPWRLAMGGRQHALSCLVVAVPNSNLPAKPMAARPATHVLHTYLATPQRASLGAEITLGFDISDRGTLWDEMTSKTGTKRYAAEFPRWRYNLYVRGDRLLGRNITNFMHRIT